MWNNEITILNALSNKPNIVKIYGRQRDAGLNIIMKRVYYCFISSVQGFHDA